MSVMPFTGATFVKENSCLVARIVSFDNVGLHLLTFRILELYKWHYYSIFLVLSESMLLSFPAAKI